MQENYHGIRILHNYNQKVIFNLIRVKEKISRVELGQITGMSATAITRLVNDFIESGLVEELGTFNVESVGRKPVMLSVCGDSMYAIGLNIDVDGLTIGIVNIDGDIVYIDTYEGRSTQAEDVVEKIVELYHTMMDRIDDTVRQKVYGMGVSMPGVVSWPDGYSEFSPQLHWNHFPLRSTLQERLQVEILVENNVKASAMAEAMFGRAQTLDDYMAIELGSGLGAALVIDGKVLRGANGLIGEIGHVLTVEDGELCDCGRRGCLQAYTCISGLEHRAGCSMAELMARAEAGDAECVAILDDAARYLSITIANLANYYNPTEIIISGRLIDQWPELFEELRVRSKRYLWHPAGGTLHLRKSEIEGGRLRLLSGAAAIFNDILLPEVVIRKSALKTMPRLV